MQDWRIEVGLRPGADALYDEALAALQGAEDIRIGHLDTGITDHPALGFVDGEPPETLLLSEGRDFVNPRATAPMARPADTLKTAGSRRYGQSAERYAEQFRVQPDHGTRTAAMILGAERNRLAGIAPGARLIPCRVANGPFLLRRAQVANLGRAMAHLLDLDTPPSVIYVGLGAPKLLGFDHLLGWLTGTAALGLDEATASQFMRARRMGVIVVAATGQLIDAVDAPASHEATIAIGGHSARSRKGLPIHYPEGGYEGDVLARIDGVDQADCWNRATTARSEDGRIEQGHAAELEQATDDLCGTALAAARVAGAAALWLALHRERLEGMGPPGAWRVAAFRSALRRHTELAPLALAAGKGTARRRILDLPALLATPPRT